MIVHLHTHSYFSLQEGLASPGALVEAAVGHGMPALALTDHLCLSGAVEFYLACREANIKPIIGLELDMQLPSNYSIGNGTVRSGRLVLLAMNLDGWANLSRLSSALLTDTSSKDLPSCSVDFLSQHTKNLLCLTGGVKGLPHQLLKRGQAQNTLLLLNQLNDLFPDRLYVELQKAVPEDERVVLQLEEIARSQTLPVVATHAIAYLKPEQAALQRTLTAIRLNTRINEIPPDAAALPGAYFIPPEEFARQFNSHPAALENISAVVERCNLDFPLFKPQFPRIPLPSGTTALELLRQKAFAGAVRRYGKITPEITSRLEHELNVISERGYETIFLIVEDVMDYARRVGVPTSSRGSAASSLIAYCLGITTPDPLYHNLYFERFLNPARSTPPDIDTDICSQGRDVVIQHVFDTYGADRVAMVGTINRFRPRSAMGDTAKAHGLPTAEIKKLTHLLPRSFYHLLARRAYSEQELFEKLSAQFAKPVYRTIFSQAQNLIGIPRHLSVHAGGLVVAPGPLTDLVPVQRSGTKEVIITQFDHKSVERMGLVKIDLLGIRGLSVLGEVAKAIHSWRRKDFAYSLDVLETIPEEDPETAEIVENARTIGCFQIESPGMRGTLRDIRAHSVDDIIRALALYRPGPLKGGLHDAYIRRHKGLEPVAQIHPALKPILEETYGVILYQEQVLRIANEIAGFSLAEAELLRRGISRFDPEDKIKTLHNHFLIGARQRHNIPSEISQQIWDMMVAFSGYGFPKAHAASYGLVAWRAAWCKAHFPAEFMSAVLANWGGYYSQRVYLNEARRMGLTVRPPHINHSLNNFKVAYPKGKPVLYMGLDQVRDLTRRTQQRAINLRPFDTLEEFMAKANPRQKELENLIQVGALDGLGTIPGLMRKLEHTHHHPGQLSLFDSSPEYSDQPDWSLSERVEAQERILGTSVDAHPLELYAGRLATEKITTSLDAIQEIGQRVRVVGIRQTSRHIRTTKGQVMAFLTLEDLEGVVEVIVFPQVYQRYRAELTGSTPLLVEGIMENNPNREEPTLHAEKIWRLE